MIVAPLLYAWKNTPPPVHVVSIPVFISVLKIIPKIFVDTSWNPCPATFPTSLRQCIRPIDASGCYRHHMLNIEETPFFVNRVNSLFSYEFEIKYT